MRLRWLMPVLLPMALLFLPEAHATTVLRVPVAEMARGSDLVIMGHVIDIKPVTDPASPKKLRTRIAIAVDKTVKGRYPKATFDLVLPGGRDDQRRMWIAGMPKFRTGEEVILFLEKTEKGFTPAGLSLGKFQIERDAATGRATARRDVPQGADLMRGPDGRMRVPSASERQDVFVLEDLLKIIREAKSAPGGAR